MRISLFLAELLATIAASSASGAPRHMHFGPPSSEVSFRAYKLGLLPLDGSFTRFTGSLTYDPDDHGFCDVRLDVDTASLATQDASLRSVVAGPEFMDVARFPSLTYQGKCEANGVAGKLNMHGVDRAFVLALAWSPGKVDAEGRLVRADWGMTARPVLGGRTIRIRVKVALPDSHRATTR